MGWYAKQKARNQAAKGIGPDAPPVIVKTVHSDAKAAKLIAKMLENGYDLDQQGTRGQEGRQHTLTFIRRNG